MTKLELMEMLRNARVVPDEAEIVLAIPGSRDIIRFNEERVLFLMAQAQQVAQAGSEPGVDMTVRVIRVLEYSFPDQATAERSLANGFVPANGVKFIDGSAGSTVIRSATTWPEEIDDEDSGSYKRGYANGLSARDEQLADEAAAEYEALKSEVERQKVGTEQPAEREVSNWLAGGDDKTQVPCGNPDEHCGIRGGTAQCAGCKL